MDAFASFSSLKQKTLKDLKADVLGLPLETSKGVSAWQSLSVRNVTADTFSAKFWEASMRPAESQIGVANLSACGTWKVSWLMSRMWKLKIVDLKQLGNKLKFEKSTILKMTI